MKKFQTVLNKTRLPGKQLISPRSARYNAALPVIPGLLLATTGLIAPDTLQAETQRCDSESTVLCSEGRQKAAVGQSQKLAAVSVKPDNGRMVINQGTTVTLSADKNTDAEWNNFNGLTVGSVTEGDLIVDGRTIGAKAGTIGQGSRGSVLLTHGAGWQMGAHLVLGTENGDGSVRVEDGSYITGIRELRIGEFYEGATGAMVITGENSSVAAASGVVGDKGVGRLDILDGGRLSIAGQMNIGYVGNTNTSQSKGNGTVNVEGAGSTLETGNGLIFGGFSEDKNDAKGELIVSDSGRVKADGFLWLGIGSGSTGIVNVGGRQGEAARQAGSIETPLIFLGNRINHDSLAVLNFNHTSEDYTLSAQIRGDGVVSHEGPGTTLLSGSNDWSGRATVSNGTLDGQCQRFPPDSAILTIGAHNVYYVKYPTAPNNFILDSCFFTNQHVTNS
jgi:autotransporter family porin